MWYTYILRCRDDTLYTGITNDLQRRLMVHNLGKAARYTAPRLPVRLVWHEVQPDRSQASKREIEIKAWSRSQKETLIKDFSLPSSETS